VNSSFVNVSMKKKRFETVATGQYSGAYCPQPAFVEKNQTNVVSNYSFLPNKSWFSIKGSTFRTALVCNFQLSIVS
jgi:hypothetical protein